MAHDVFISHSAKDKATADALCAMLESEGIRCWIAPRDVLPSMEWGEAIIDAIEGSKIMVLVFSAHANDSPQIRREVERAVNHSVAILPIRIEDVLPAKSLEYFIGSVHWLDAMTPPLETHLKNLAATVRLLLDRMAPHDAPPVAPVIAKEAPEAVRPQFVAPTVPRITTEGPLGVKPLAPRGFWGSRTWTWAAGTVAAMVVAVVVGMHFNSNSGSATSPQPVAAPVPAQPDGTAPRAVGDNSAQLQETIATLQGELSSIGTVSFAANGHSKTDGTRYQDALVQHVTNVVADAAQCNVSYHWTEVQNGKTDWEVNNAGFPLRDVTSVVVESYSQYRNEANIAEGHPEYVDTSTNPPMTALIVYRSKEENLFPFTEVDVANRTAATITQAVKLCGGNLSN